MIKPQFNPFFDAAAFALSKNAMRRRFHAIYVRGLEHAQAIDTDRPVIICPNHTNWWDGFLARYLSEYLPDQKCRRHLMQQENFLRKSRFFRWMGVYGIDLENPLPSLRFSLKLLEDDRVQLWMFPQGDLVPQWLPVEVRRGIELLVRKSRARVLPMIFRYEWLIESRPTIFVEIGPVLDPPEFSAETLQTRMRGLYERSTPEIAKVNLDKFEPLMPPRMSINKRVEYFLHLLRRPGSNFDRHNR